MKKVLLVSMLLIVSVSLLATVRTVSNISGGQFLDINSAIIASSPGDTIYIMGSQFAYCRPTTVKDNLTFIGPGFNPQKQVPYIATITCGLWPVGNNNTFIGLYIEGFNYNPNCSCFQGLTVKRCQITANLAGGCPSYSNILYEDCLFINMTLCTSNGNCFPAGSVSNLTIRNSIFYNSTIWGFASSVFNVLADHNIFITNSGGGAVFSSTPANAQVNFTNNIFYNRTATLPGNGCIYNNNFSTTENLNINGGTNNLQGPNPMFINYAGGAFAFSNNFHLAPGSPCIGSGSDGNDMGIYAGVAPFVWEGHPPIPQIDIMNLIGTQVPQGGSLKVSFQATIKN